MFEILDLASGTSLAAESGEDVVEYANRVGMNPNVLIISTATRLTWTLEDVLNGRFDIEWTAQ